LHDLGRHAEAVDALQRALQLGPNDPDIHRTLGAALAALGQLDQAEAAYREAIRRRPTAASCYVDLGTVLQRREQWQEAAEAYQKALELEPSLADAHSNLGNVLRHWQRPDEALARYRTALQIKPEHADARYNLGVVLQEMGQLDEALAAYEEVLRLRPDYAPAYHNLALVHSQRDEQDRALSVVRRWLGVEPASALAAHLAAALGGGPAPQRASNGYIREEFDRFAADFDQQLQRLGYRAPELVLAEVEREFGSQVLGLDVLDAGCGTGLCGPGLRGRAGRLVGVDLSPEMLKRAADRGVYDELVEAELTDYLNRSPAMFDLIVAVDTLNYFGVLESVFQAARRALRTGGRLVFTLEVAETEDAAAGYRLNPHGRYSHAWKYVKDALDSAQLTLWRVSTAVLRTEGGRGVNGWIVAAGRP
jgi:predicted TPR repeat methyltransferase